MQVIPESNLSVSGRVDETADAVEKQRVAQLKV